MAASLANKVRASTESDEFDLGNYGMDQCTTLCQAAFSEPLDIGNMIRLSFIVGGGKLTRQKYSDTLPKEFMSALSNVGYDDNKAAACELSSAGSYKFQHDTGKNLKFVHVFPRVSPLEEGGEEGGEGEEGGGTSRNEPADVLALAEMDDFQRLLDTRLPTYATKRRLLEQLKARLTILETAEKKLCNRETLNAEEQELYDMLSVDGLKERVTVVQKEIQAAVEAGNLTSDEKAMALEELEGKLPTLDTAIQKAEADSKPKMAQKLQEQKDKLQQTIKQVKDSDAQPPPPLKHGSEIQRLRIRLAGLIKLEKEHKGNYTMEQLKGLGEKPEIEEAIEELEARSRLWLESDAEFKVRLDICMKQAKPKAKAKPTGGGYSSGGASAWSTVGKKR